MKVADVRSRFKVKRAPTRVIDLTVAEETEDHELYIMLDEHDGLDDTVHLWSHGNTSICGRECEYQTKDRKLKDLTCPTCTYMKGGAVSARYVKRNEKK